MAISDHLAPVQISSIAKSDSRVNLWTGSIRSGKTIASLLRFLIFVGHAPSGGALVIVGRTRESIGRNLFVPLMDPALFGVIASHIRYNTGAPTASVLGRTIHILGASDARAEMVLRGLTVSGAYVDEATLVSEDFWIQLIGRMSVPGAQLFATTNPDGPSHWLKKQVIDRAEELGYKLFRFKLTDNTHLDPAYVAQVCKEYTGLWYKRYILGEWVQAAGAIYEMWDPELHVIAHSALPKMDRVLCLGLDYGDTHATRGILLGVGRAADRVPRLYILDEWAPGNMTVGEHAKDLRIWMSKREEELWRTPEWLYVDPAAGSFRHQLFHDGMSNVGNASNSVLSGIRTVSSLIATGRLLVSDRCTHLIERIPGYVWDPVATARGEDKPIKSDDDEVDAMRYAIFSTRALWRNLVPIATVADNAPGMEGVE